MSRRPTGRSQFADRPVRIVRCAFCREPFETRDPRQRYCSLRHRSLATTRRWRAKQPPKEVPV